MARLTAAFLAKTVYRLLRPLASFCITHSIKFQDFSDAAKRAFIDAAREELKRSGHRETDSKLSVMTGLQRKDVARLRTSVHEEATPNNLITRIIGLWLSPAYEDEEGKPQTLSYEGKASSFADLVHEVSSDLNHHTILFELERLGIVRRSAKRAELQVPALVVRGDAERGLPLLSADMEDLVHGVLDNIIADPKTPNLHAKTEYDNIPAEFIPKIRAWLIELGQGFHRQAREFLSHYDRDTNPDVRGTGPASRVAVGTFSVTQTPKTNLPEGEDS